MAGPGGWKCDQRLMNKEIVWTNVIESRSLRIGETPAGVRKPGRDWDSAKAFDLVIDTGKTVPDLAADLIARAAKAVRATGRSGEAKAADLKVDRILAEAVQEELRQQMAPVGQGAHS